MFVPSAYSDGCFGAHDAKHVSAKEKAVLAKAGKGDPAKLWTTDPKHRPVSVLGAASQLLGVPSDAILCIADGARPGPGFVAAEYRKSVLGGLLALQSAGVPVHTKGLHAPLVGNAKADDKANAALAKAAGLHGEDLEHVYHAVVTRVSSYGPAMKALAWAHRVELWLSDVSGIEKVHAMSGAVVSLFVPIGTAVGALIGAHSAITMALARKIGERAASTIKHSLPKAKAEVSKKHGAGGVIADHPAVAGAGSPSGSSIPWMWIGLGAAGLGGIYLYSRSAR